MTISSAALKTGTSGCHLQALCSVSSLLFHGRLCSGLVCRHFCVCLLSLVSTDLFGLSSYHVQNRCCVIWAWASSEPWVWTKERARAYCLPDGPLKPMAWALASTEFQPPSMASSLSIFRSIYLLKGTCGSFHSIQTNVGLAAELSITQKHFESALKNKGS